MIKNIFLVIVSLFLVVGNVVTANAKYYSGRLCNSSQYICKKVKRGDTWRKLFKDPDQRDVVMRLNRSNMRLRPGRTIAIPKNLEDITHFDISPFPLQINSINQKKIIVDLNELAWGAYNQDGYLIHWGPVSGGRGWCKDVGRPCRTATGNYRLLRKQGYNCVSSKFPLPFGGAAMPYCMHYYGGYALHGSFEVPGYNASHGCIRMFITDARWLNNDFADYKTKVVVRPY